MKLRIRGNSIRLRLTQGEVARFADSGQVEETVEFGGREDQRFVYTLSSSTESDAVSAVLENNRIAILVPRSQVADWAKTNQVSIRAAQPLGDDKALQILIEKDFACPEDRPGEDDSDAFPHPPTGKVC